MTERKTVLLPKHKKNGAKKAHSAKKTKRIPTPELKWGEKK
jgi:hypothetical protein